MVYLRLLSRTILLASIILCNLALNSQNASTHTEIKWEVLEEIPPKGGESIQPGLAGAFIGLIDDKLFIAGGANFPDGPAWEGGSKVYHNDIYILEKSGDSYTWLANQQLSREVAYGVSINTGGELICIGGMDASARTARVFSMRWDDLANEIIFKDYPSLPNPLANMVGGLIDDKIYLAATDEATNQKYFLSLDLNGSSDEWTELPTWPGKARTHAYGAVQDNGDGLSFYLMKGRLKEGKSVSQLLPDCYEYNPSNNQWKILNTKINNRDQELLLSAGTAVATGANHILLIGGDDGTIFNQLEQLEFDIGNSPDTISKKQLIASKNAIMKTHPGFTKNVWSFHTVTQAWTRVTELPTGSQVTTSALIWDGELIIPTGEISPCNRSPEIVKGTIVSKRSFGILNYTVLFIYLLALVILGFYFSRNQFTTEDFFKGGQRIPAWAAGLSIFGTQLSAITFMTIPAKTFATDWLYFFLMMTIIMISPFIVKYFLPFYRRNNLTTAYEYLEHRFNLPTRLIGSSMYILLQFGRLAIVLLLPSLALSVVTGIDVRICILTMGILSISYTVLGGIEAVIWTDVIQVFVLLGGALLALIIMLFNLDASTIYTEVHNFDKLKIFDATLSFSSPTLWVVLLGGLASNLIQYGSDQTVVQRYLTTKNEKEAAKSVYLGAWMTLPSALLFFSLGTLLFVFYKSNPEALSFGMEKTDSIFPWYIVNNLPDGISGLLIAAIFAASMSSLDSSMNSVSTVVTTDFIKRLMAPMTEKKYLLLARIITLVVGLIGTVLAFIMASWGISSLWDQFNMIVGLFVGGLGGIFLLGIFVPRANGKGAVVGLLVSGLLQYLIKTYTDTHLLLYAFTGAIASFMIGYIISLMTGQPSDNNLQWTFKNVEKT